MNPGRTPEKSPHTRTTSMVRVRAVTFKYTSRLSQRSDYSSLYFHVFWWHPHEMWRKLHLAKKFQHRSIISPHVSIDMKISSCYIDFSVNEQLCHFIILEHCPNPSWYHGSEPQWQRIDWVAARLSRWVWYFISKTSRAFDVLIHSRALLATILSWLVTLQASQVAARFWCFRSRSASCHHTYVASASQYPSLTCNCARLL